jgi:Na+/proline symporter
MIWFALVALVAVSIVILNVFVTTRLMRSDEARGRNALFAFGIWVFPFVGALLVFIGLAPSPVSPHPVNDPKNPGSP